MRLNADGFEEAFIGIGMQFSRDLSVYDWDKCIEILMKRDDMEYDEAVEFMEFNVIGAWVGDHTPVFVKLGDGLNELEGE